MGNFYCHQQSCGFSAPTKHGVEIHILRAHKRASSYSITKPRRSGPQNIKGRLPVPRALNGRGMRLAVDRMTNEVQGDISETIIEETVNRIREKILPPDIHKEMTDKSLEFSEGVIVGNERLCDAFLRVAKVTGDRICDDLMEEIRKELDQTVKFLKLFDCIQTIREHQRSARRAKLDRGGFVEKEYIEDGIKFKMFQRDPVEVLKCQLRHTPSNGLMTKPVDSNVFTHPINSVIGTQGFRAAEEHIKMCSDRNVCWRYRLRDGEESFIGGVEFFSDKSQTSLNASSLSFYPLHITLVNFTEEWRRRHIVQGDTIVAYLPVKYELDDCDGELEDMHLAPGTTAKIPRVRLLKILHSSVGHAVSPLRDMALQGIPTFSSDGRRLRIHCMVVSYIADLPEAQDMLCVKRGVLTPSPCHRCLIPRTSMPLCGNGTPRTLKHCLDILNKLNTNECSEETFKELSMLTFPPVLSNFPMVGLQPCVDIYRIFRVEPMHVLSLGVSRLLKDCTFVMLKDDTRVSPNIVTTSGNGRTFKSVRRIILHHLNQFLREVEASAVGYGLHVDFSKGECGQRLSGFFTENGVVGMIEAKDYDNVDMVAPFMGAIIDLCCGLEHAPVTECYVQYVDIYNMVFRTFVRPGWTDQDLTDLSYRISKFKVLGRETFSAYQPSMMGTEKWHALDHIVQDIRDVGDIHSLHGGLYEGAHRLFKKSYQKTSKRVQSAMRDTLRLENERAITSDVTEMAHRANRPNEARVQAVKTDGGFLVKAGVYSNLLELEDARRNTMGFSQTSGAAIVNRHIGKMSDALGEDGMLSLLKLLREYLTERGVPLSEQNRVRLQFPASAYVSGYYPPSLNSPSSGSSVYLHKSTLRVSQRIVAKACFYGVRRLRFDSIMVESNETDAQYPSLKYFPVWFARAMAFVRVGRCGGEGERGAEVRRSEGEHSYERSKRIFEKELCFVQFYEVLHEYMLNVDRIDIALGCVRLRWHRTDGEPGVLSSSKEYGLVPVDSIRGRIHVVRGDKALPLLSNDVIRKKQLNNACGVEGGWSSHMFYVNRFYRCRGEVYDFEEDMKENE